MEKNLNFKRQYTAGKKTLDPTSQNLRNELVFIYGCHEFYEIEEHKLYSMISNCIIDCRLSSTIIILVLTKTLSNLLHHPFQIFPLIYLDLYISNPFSPLPPLLLFVILSFLALPLCSKDMILHNLPIDILFDLCRDEHATYGNWLFPAR